MLNVYSRTRDGETLLSRSFRAKEFACKDGTDPLFVDSELVQVLQAIRDHFGAPVVITSGYRTAAHNRAVGGAVYSQHQYGRAADIRVSGVPVEQLAAVPKDQGGGIGSRAPQGERPFFTDQLFPVDAGADADLCFQLVGHRQHGLRDAGKIAAAVLGNGEF